MKTLYELGLKYDTDKSTKHLFTVVYDIYFNELREQNINLLEIGILNGSSLKCWNEYFKNANIYGADIKDCSMYDSDKIKTFITNQLKVEELMLLPKNNDIIIDDGGHTMEQQQITFKTLFLDNLKSGGIYIIEDLHTSLFYYGNKYNATEHNNTYSLLCDLKNGFKKENSDYFVNDKEFDELYEKISSIKIFDIKYKSSTSIIIKK